MTRGGQAATVCRCPECGEDGLAEPSTRVSASEHERLDPRAPRHVRCHECDALYVVEGPGSLARLPEPLGGPSAPVVTPREGSPGASELQRSWDMVERHYRALEGDARFQPLRALIARLRAEGFDAQLHAGQSRSHLILSRSSAHAPPEGHSRLTFAVEPDGRVKVEGRIGGTKYRFGPVPATFGGRIRRALENLAELPMG